MVWLGKITDGAPRAPVSQRLNVLQGWRQKKKWTFRGSRSFRSSWDLSVWGLLGALGVVRTSGAPGATLGDTSQFLGVTRGSRGSKKFRDSRGCSRGNTKEKLFDQDANLPDLIIKISTKIFVIVTEIVAICLNVKFIGFSPKLSNFWTKLYEILTEIFDISTKILEISGKLFVISFKNHRDF